MIKVILKGGMGNQMFQYALGKSLALKNNTDLYLDLSFLKTRIPFKEYTPLKGFTYRDYDLDLFGVRDSIGTLFSNDFLNKYFSYFLASGYNRLINKNYVKEGPNLYEYKPEILKKGENTTLEGFWNNYKYFKDYEKEISEIFDTHKLFDSKFDKFEQEIKGQENSVALHIRRGDYLNDKHISVYVGLGAKYFRSAIDLMRSKLKNPYFYIFSKDDPDWFESELTLDKKEYTLVTNDYSGYKNRSHFRFMSICKHAIISNSTYSWWAAYLNKNPKKLVITPSKWQYDYKFENVPSWIALDP